MFNGIEILNKLYSLKLFEIVKISPTGDTMQGNIGAMEYYMMAVPGGWIFFKTSETFVFIPDPN